MVKEKTTLTFYGGVDEVGGNKILLNDRGTKIFLDFGMSFAMRKKYYSPPFLSPRTEESLKELGILPSIKGIYKNENPEVRAIFLSHAHMDHSAYISFINREIPVYCGETTKTILKALSDIRTANLEFNVEDVNFKPFRTGDKIKIDSLEVEPVHVDHSVPGAYGFIIHTSSGGIVYTGDFRTHGTKSELTEDFVEKAKEVKPVVFITEATNMIGANVSSEEEVRKKLNAIAAQTDGAIFADFAHTDMDRLRSFYQTAKKNNRFLVISPKQAYLLNSLSKDKHLKVPSLRDERILIFEKSKKTRRKWEKTVLESYSEKIVDAHKISEEQNKIILVMSFYDLEELVKIHPNSGSCYISSSSEPFNEEMEMDFERLISWLQHYGLPQYHVHVSGHIMPLDLKEILMNVKAKTVFPVHTEHAELFAGFMGNIESRVLIPEKFREYEI